MKALALIKVDEIYAVSCYTHISYQDRPVGTHSARTVAQKNPAVPDPKAGEQAGRAPALCRFWDLVATANFRV